MFWLPHGNYGDISADLGGAILTLFLFSLALQMFCDLQRLGAGEHDYIYFLLALVYSTSYIKLKLTFGRYMAVLINWLHNIIEPEKPLLTAYNNVCMEWQRNWAVIDSVTEMLESSLNPLQNATTILYDYYITHLLRGKSKQLHCNS